MGSQQTSLSCESEVTEWLKNDENQKSIPVIAVTVFAMTGDEERILNGGCDAYIVKRISLSDFLETVERFAKPLLAKREAELSPMVRAGPGKRPAAST